MSDKTMTLEEAHETLLYQIHHPVFFNKLAHSYNIVPKSEEEAADLLKIATQLRYVAQHEHNTKVHESGSAIKQASQELDNVLSQYYGASVPTQSDEDIKVAASQAVQNPLFKQAATVFGVALVENAQAQ